MDENINDSIKAVTEGIDSAWNKGDAKAFASYWAEEGTIINPFGDLTESRKKIEEEMAIQFAGDAKGTTHRLNIDKIYTINDSVVMIDGISEVITENGTFPGPYTAVLTLQENGNWVMEHMRGYTFMPKKQ